MTVHTLQVRPKEKDLVYHRHPIHLIYLPDTGRWKWMITHTHVMHLTGECKTQGAALREAKRTIDNIKDVT